MIIIQNSTKPISLHDDPNRTNRTNTKQQRRSLPRSVAIGIGSDPRSLYVNSLQQM
jgi:hypothetical protein